MNNIELLKEVAKRRKELESLVDGFSGDANEWKLASLVMNGFMTYDEAVKFFKGGEDA